MAHEVPPLPYDYNALEPHIDEQTMRIHHDKHHAAYVNNLNAALEGLDDLAALPIEELIGDLRGRYAIVIVTHNMQQAARVSQRTAFFHLGELIEYGETSEIFTNPRVPRTKDYITGRYG